MANIMVTFNESHKATTFGQDGQVQLTGRGPLDATSLSGWRSRASQLFSGSLFFSTSSTRRNQTKWPSTTRPNLHFPKEARQDRHYFTCLAARLAAEVHDFNFGLCGY
ncbi:MAG: hypothetical protein ABGY13_10040 [Verrucomicrobiia bacterium]